MSSRSVRLATAVGQGSVRCGLQAQAVCALALACGVMRAATTLPHHIKAAACPPDQESCLGHVRSSCAAVPSRAAAPKVPPPPGTAGAQPRRRHCRLGRPVLLAATPFAAGTTHTQHPSQSPCCARTHTHPRTQGGGTQPEPSRQPLARQARTATQTSSIRNRMVPALRGPVGLGHRPRQAGSYNGAGLAVSRPAGPAAGRSVCRPVCLSSQQQRLRSYRHKAGACVPSIPT